MRNDVQLTKLDVKIHVDTTPRTLWQIHHSEVRYLRNFRFEVRKFFKAQRFLGNITHSHVKHILSTLVYRGEIRSLYTTCSDGEKGTVYWR